MTKQFDNGGDAFPNRGDGVSYDGMSLWDFFAAHALGGFIDSIPKGASYTMGDLAHDAAEAADAIIAERNKRMKP